MPIIIIWIINVIIWLFSPFSSIYGSYYAVILTTLMIMFFILGSMTGKFLLKKKLLTPISSHKVALVSEKFIFTLTLLSLIGLAFHFYDKIVLRGYDYTQCIDIIRNQWLTDGLGREGISSMSSALGYILLGCSFPATLLTLIFLADENKSKYYFL